MSFALVNQDMKGLKTLMLMLAFDVGYYSCCWSLTDQMDLMFVWNVETPPMEKRDLIDQD